MPQTPPRWSVFLIVATGVFMSTMDSSMVNIALPSIMHEFRSSLYVTQWVMMIYLLTITVSLLFWGHLADRLGRRKIYSLGMLLFGGFSFFCATAPHVSLLIGCRLGQAMGAAMMMSSGPAIIKENSPSSQLGRNLGLIGVATGLGLMTGPPLSGFLIQYFSWRSIFYITVPIGLLFSILAVVLLPEKPRLEDHKRIDITGSLGWAVTIILFMLAISGTAAKTTSYLLAGCCPIALIMFLRHEARIDQPLFPLNLMRQKIFLAATITALLSFAVLFAVIIMTPFYLDRILALPASQIGMIMMSIPLAVMFVSPVAGRLADKIDSQYLTTLGLSISTTSVVLLTNLAAGTSLPAIAAILAMLGAGQAIFLSPNSTSVLGNVDNSQAGVSAGLLATARNLGMLLGVALAGAVFSINFSRLTNGLDMKDFTPAHAGDFLAALHTTFLAAAAVGTGGIIISWLRGKTRLKE